MIVTTTPMPSDQLAAKAKQLAKQLHAQWVERRRSTVNQLLNSSDDGKALIATENELRFYDIQAQDASKPLVYHPSMAYVKLKGMLQGRQEPLIAISDCQAGDIVIDCTAGLASDSLVFSLAVGEAGKVIALESELILYTLVSEGLKSYRSNVPEIEAAMRNIEMHHASHLSFLQSQPSKSVDIVYFDPMFREPLHDASGIKPIRIVANHEALDLEAIEQAKRVARKCVVLKENSRSGEFDRLGFKRVGSQQGHKVAYGIIKC